MYIYIYIYIYVYTSMKLCLYQMCLRNYMDKHLPMLYHQAKSAADESDAFVRHEMAEAMGCSSSCLYCGMRMFHVYIYI